MILSAIIPSLGGNVPSTLPDDPRLEVVLVEGLSPVGKARNEGLRQATGDYVAWVDADDEVADEWLDAIFAALESSPDVIVIDAKLTGWENRGDYVWGLKAEDATIERLRRDVYRDICRPSNLWLYVTKRELWDGLSFDEAARVAEDYLILPKVLERAKSCVYIPKMLYRYVCSSNSLINTQDYELDMEVTKLWARRLREAPREHRGECLWGMAVSCYWVCDRVALSAGESVKPGAAEYAHRCRKVIRRSMGFLLHEVIVECDLNIWDRLAWYFRFMCAATDWWLPQKLCRMVRR